MAKYIYKYKKAGQDWHRVNVPGHEAKLFPLDQLTEAEAYRDSLVAEGVKTGRVSGTKTNKANTPKTVRRSKKSIKPGDRVKVWYPFTEEWRISHVVSVLSAQFTYREDGKELLHMCLFKENWEFIVE